jgi:hypothetical protein
MGHNFKTGFSSDLLLYIFQTGQIRVDYLFAPDAYGVWMRIRFVTIIADYFLLFFGQWN